MLPRRIAILASGEGSNMRAIAAACAAGQIAGDICLVLSNRADARVLEHAQNLDLPHRCVEHRAFPDRETFDGELARVLHAHGAELVVLAGFMRILTDAFVRQYCGCLLNIHPSLLPKYPGLHTHRRALEAGDRVAGATVHFVVPELDAGPAVLQAAVPVVAGDTPESLAARVLAEEHRIYPQAIAWWTEGRLDLRDGRAYLDGELIAHALQLETTDTDRGEPPAARREPGQRAGPGRD